MRPIWPPGIKERGIMMFFLDLKAHFALSSVASHSRVIPRNCRVLTYPQNRNSIGIALDSDLKVFVRSNFYISNERTKSSSKLSTQRELWRRPEFFYLTKRSCLCWISEECLVLLQDYVLALLLLLEKEYTKKNQSKSGDEWRSIWPKAV